jgi:hypothetical protein
MGKSDEYPRRDHLAKTEIIQDTFIPRGDLGQMKAMIRKTYQPEQR